jgi:FkbM family methyltransferase
MLNNMKNPKYLIRPLLRKFGRDLVVFNHMHHPIARHAKLLETYGIDMVLDIGANTGQYSQGLREFGYKGNIVCFEPLSSAYTELRHWAEKDGKAIAINSAVGDFDGNIEFNVSANSVSSSVLDMLPSHIDAAPDSKIANKEKVTICRLDTVFDKYCKNEHKILLKVDTQGYEMSVLLGAEASLAKIRALELEMSFIPLYEGQALFHDIYLWLLQKGFQMVDIEPMFIHPDTGEVFQVDGMFRAPDDIFNT